MLIQASWGGNKAVLPPATRLQNGVATCVGVLPCRKAAVSGSEPADAIRAVNALLTQLDQLKAHPNVMVLTTSNITGATWKQPRHVPLPASPPTNLHGSAACLSPQLTPEPHGKCQSVQRCNKWCVRQCMHMVSKLVTL